MTIGERLAALDWQAIERSLGDIGYARTQPILTVEECAELASMYTDERRFRSKIDMERHGFGVGEYKYFARPLPRLVADLRTHAYRRLAPIANRWSTLLGSGRRFPLSLQGFLAVCGRSGQTKPTPLLLRYAEHGYNCLHQDVYGDVSFPMQVTCFLSRPDVDYGGGEFVLVEQRPRMQSRAHVVPAEQGAFVIFPNGERPVAGRRGVFRARMRHGLSRLVWGSRYALGIIFHDAR